MEYGNNELVPPPPTTDLEMANGRGGGSDNRGYQADAAGENNNHDSLSHKTTSTGMCETSQTEYINRSSGGLVPETAAMATAASAVASNVKMLFQANEQISITPSMDEADAEVAGIYKKFKTESPLTVRMDTMEATPPPPKKQMPKTGQVRRMCVK